MEQGPGTKDLHEQLERVNDPQGLAELLRVVHARADRPSLRTLEKWATDKAAPPLSRTPVSEMLRGVSLPRKALMTTFLQALGVSPAHLDPWVKAWERVAGEQELRSTASSPVSASALARPQVEPLEWSSGKPVEPIQVDRRIMLWGAPGSGKTCFLAALNIAVAQAERHWTLVGSTPAATEYLTRATASLVRDRSFPSATQGFERCSWIMGTDVEIRTGRGWRKKIKHVPLRFQIDIIDPAGDFFRRRHGPNWDFLIDHLQQCDGIIYLYDHDRERQWGDAYEYFHHVLGELERRALETRLRSPQGDTQDGRLHHRLAVCVGKFDTPTVFQAAVEGGHLVENRIDSRRPLTIPNDRAKLLFEQLCRESRDAELLRLSIGKSFHPDRTRYFATSSIGFYVGESNPFNPDDCCNATLTDDGCEWVIRGAVKPVNVLEPLLWLQAPVAE